MNRAIVPPFPLLCLEEGAAAQQAGGFARRPAGLCLCLHPSSKEEGKQNLEVQLTRTNTMAEAQTSGTRRARCIGAVIDIEFLRDAMPGSRRARARGPRAEKASPKRGSPSRSKQQLGDGGGVAASRSAPPTACASA